MTVTDDSLRNNADFAKTFVAQRRPAHAPGKGLAVVACMDARLNVYALLGLQEGQAHVIRNAGGVVSDDVLRLLVISQRLLGTREVILVHHTDCGMLTFTDDQVKADIEADVGLRPHFARGLLRPGARHPPVDRPHQGQPVRAQQGLDPRLHLRRHHRPGPGGHLSIPARLRRRGAAARRRTPARRRRRGRARRTRSRRERRRVGPHGGDVRRPAPAGTGRCGLTRRRAGGRPGAGGEQHPEQPGDRPRGAAEQRAKTQPEQADGAQVERAPEHRPGHARVAQGDVEPLGRENRLADQERGQGRAGTGRLWSARARRPCPTAPAAAAGPRRS